MSQARAPLFSVIVATYNWSAALRCALASIAGQQLTDFEVLVIGDACTDDSEAAVRELGDARFQWHNLAQNCGSQWGPNNHGLSLARGRYVAYLGHDDLWWPTHLQDALDTFERSGADMVAAATLMYGPAESGVRAISGFFPNDRYTPLQFFPPSSMCHRRELAERVGGWLAPEQAKLVVDHDFLVRCQQAGALIVATGEFTTFKFNAAWRRNAYRLRGADEQREHLRRMREEGEVFRRRELSATLRAAAEDRLLRIEMPTRDVSAVAKTLSNQRFKGSHRADQAVPAVSTATRWRFPAQQEYAGFEWHDLEHHGQLGAFRWTGPSTRSVLHLPIRPDQRLRVSLHVIHQLGADRLERAELRANGVLLQTSRRAVAAGGSLWQAELDPQALPEDEREELNLEIRLPFTERPSDLGLGEDRRWLGLAIGTVEVEPLSSS